MSMGFARFLIIGVMASLLGACASEGGGGSATSASTDAVNLEAPAKPSIVFEEAKVTQGAQNATFIDLYVARELNGAENQAFTGHVALNIKCRVLDASQNVVYQNDKCGGENVHHLHISMPGVNAVVKAASLSVTLMGLQAGTAYVLEAELVNAYHGADEAKYDVSSVIEKFPIPL